MFRKSALFILLAFFSLAVMACDTSNTRPMEPKTTTTDSQRLLFTVTFNLNGGEGEAPEEQIVDSGEKAEGPQNDPTRSGYVFAGWFASPEGEELFDFENTPILSNTILYAGWTPIVP